MGPSAVLGQEARMMSCEGCGFWLMCLHWAKLFNTLWNHISEELPSKSVKETRNLNFYPRTYGLQSSFFQYELILFGDWYTSEQNNLLQNFSLTFKKMTIQQYTYQTHDQVIKREMTNNWINPSQQQT